MSLTRKQWEDFWNMTKRMERYIDNIPPHVGYKKALKMYIRSVKDIIQSVIGQME